MSGYKVNTFPRSRIATNDICTIGVRKHHIAALLEIDVTEIRNKLKSFKEHQHTVSFTAWLVKVICATVREYEDVTSFLIGKRKIMVFENINVSLLVEKDLDGKKIPVPLLMEKADEMSVEKISNLILEARLKKLNEKESVLHEQPGRLDALYYSLPGVIRRIFWKYLLRNPRLAFGKMGNVAITSVGMMGRVNGWFIPISIHPLCFGIGSIMKKAVVIEDKVEIREVLNMTVLLDHDIVDGGLMTRFVCRLSENLEKATE